MAEQGRSGHRLRRRLTLALAGLAASAALLVGLAYWGSEHWIEEATLQERLSLELDGLINAGAVPLAHARDSKSLAYYRPAKGGPLLPPELASLPPGDHSDVLIGGIANDVLVREIGPGDRAVLAYRDSEAATRRRWLALSILTGVLATGLAAVWLAARLSRQTLVPLDSLVCSLQALDVERRGWRVPEPAPDSELAVITQALNAYLSRIDELVERERAFAASASHELRTPLAVIQGAAEVLQQTGSASPPVARILRAARSAQHDLDALLWLSRSDATPQAETIVLHECLQALCAAQLDVDAVQWNLAPCTTAAPPGAVGIIVSNLLRNSLNALARRGNALPDSGGVRVTLSANMLTVDDDGPGIPADELPHVFAPRTRGTDGGTGMGLYIAATLAARLGWTLTLENRAEAGARAVLRFSR